MQRQQCKSFVLFLSFTVKVLVWQEFKLISLLTVCTKQRGERRSQATSLYDKCNDGYCSGLRSFFLGLKVNWLDTLTVKQCEIMINNDALLFSATNEETAGP